MEKRIKKQGGIYFSYFPDIRSSDLFLNPVNLKEEKETDPEKINSIVLDYRTTQWSEIFPILKRENPKSDDSKYIHIFEMIKMANNFLLMRSYIEFVNKNTKDEDLA